MRIHLLSDLHNEFDLFEPEVRDADVVILAGDINVKTRGVEWAKNTFTCPVLYVPGNHEFYGGHLTRTLEKMRAASSDQVGGARSGRSDPVRSSVSRRDDVD